MRKTSLFQLNIWYGKHIQTIINYILEKQPDIVTLQEVASPRMQIYKHGSVGVDCIKELCEKLPEYKLCFFPAATYIDEPREYFGQANQKRANYM
jgi:hypothetical protein